MSGGRILVVDIAGVDTALATSSRGVSQWAVTVAAKLKMGSIPPGMSLSVDPSTGQSDTGALSLQARDISALLTDVSVTAATRIDGAISATDTSIDYYRLIGIDEFMAKSTSQG